MPAKKVKRSPVKSKAKKKAAPKIRKDPLKEYQEAMREKGVVEILTLTDDDALATVKRHISTQSLELDRLLNGKGIPCGRVTEIFGPNHIGKSTLLDHMFASVQAQGGIAILADTEVSRDMTYCQALGVDIDKMQLLEFARGEMHAENVLQKIMDSATWWADHYPDTPVVIGWDALGGTSTKAELEKQLGESSVAAMARVMRQACRRIPAAIGNTNVALVVLNHEYQKVQAQGGFVGKRKESYGGEAIRHAATIRIELYPCGWVKTSDGVVLGRQVGVKVVKNRLGAAWGEGKVAVLSSRGIDNAWSVFERLKSQKIITSSGSWAAINLDGEVYRWQGFNGLTQLVADKPELWPKLVELYGRS